MKLSSTLAILSLVSLNLVLGLDIGLKKEAFKLKYLGDNVVQTTAGPIRGVIESDPKVTAFYGIPFAAPPVGENRFREPKPPQPWTEVKDCSKDLYTHICPQYLIEHKTLLGSEDCLYMNVFVPGNLNTSDSLPVMFWIYGGGFTIGDGYEFGYYRGKYIAAQRNVIVVEFNYRLGSLGFLALPALKSESASGSTGNYGVQDQQAALQFAHANAAAFGGNPNQITIYGESAGAFSVCFHIVSEVSRPFFAAAIMESGTCEAAEFFVSLPRAYEFGTEVAAMAGCNQSDSAAMVACMRKAHINTLFLHDWPKNKTIPPLAPIMPYGPTIDGVQAGLLKRPIELMREGNFAKVPILLGSNRNEGSVFVADSHKVVPGVKLPLSDNDVKLLMLHFFNDTTAAAVLEKYPSSAFKNEEERVGMILRDFFFLCTSVETASVLSDQGAKVFLYQFTPDLKNWVDYLALGDYHSLELPFVFNHQYPIELHKFSAEEQALSNQFTAYWTNLVHGGPSNGPATASGLINWPSYNTSTRLSIELTIPELKLNSAIEEDKCKFWDTHYTKYYFN